MFYSTLLIATGALSCLVGAQNMTPTYTVDPGSVDINTREAWCRGQTGNCPSICGGQAFPNTCDPDTLTYKCTCSDGSKPNISDYTATLPSFECGAWFSQCIAAAGNSLAQQNKCLSVACGSKNASTVEQTSGGSGGSGSASSAAPSGSASATATSGGGGSSGSTGGAASASSSGAAIAMNVGRNYGTGILAGGLLAVFGLAL